MREFLEGLRQAERNFFDGMQNVMDYPLPVNVAVQ
jgi:hypothetical protein